MNRSRIKYKLHDSIFLISPALQSQDLYDNFAVLNTGNYSYTLICVLTNPKFNKLWVFTSEEPMLDLDLCFSHAQKT